LQETGSGIVFGEILSVSPLEIMVDNRLKLPEEFFLTSALCHTVYSWSSVFFTENQPHSHYIPETVTSKVNNHTHDISRIAVKEDFGEKHRHVLVEFATERENEHFHMVKPKAVVIGEHMPFDDLTNSPFNGRGAIGQMEIHPPRWEKFYEEHNNHIFSHYHDINGIVLNTEAADDGHFHQIKLEGKTLMTLLKSTLWRSIRPGDLVNMVMASDKQKFYVIERQGMGGIQ